MTTPGLLSIFPEKPHFLLTLVVSLFCLQFPAVTFAKQVGIANPASVNCKKSGGLLHFEERTNGDSEATCVFPDGQRCEEWSLFLGECRLGDDSAGPFAYCKRVSTSGVLPAEETAESIPEALLQPMIEQGLLSGSMPAPVRAAAKWRCMSGKVWVCAPGANIPCEIKADLSKVPASQMKNFCRSRPDQMAIPAYVSGRATVYTWECRNNASVIKQQIFTPDAAGYISEFWQPLQP